MKTVYFDNNGTTPVHPKALEALLPFYREDYGNPSSLYAGGRKARKAVERAREQVAKLIGAHPEEILFTSCGSESNNTVLKGVANARRDRGEHIITSCIEHPSVLNSCRYLEKKGFRVTYLPVDRDGMVNLDSLRESVTSETILISVMLANNETGAIQPVSEIASIAAGSGAFIHTDAIQSAGKMVVNVGELGVDALSLSGHKFYAPKGIGVLYVRAGSAFEPFLHGGHQEEGRRAGTENVAYIAGLATAVDLIMENREADEARIEGMRDRFEAALLENIPAIEINGRNSPRLANTSNVACHYIEGEGILYSLSEHGICASSGSACTSGSLEPSHVLRAMQVPFTAVQGSTRFSFSRYTTDEEVDHIIKVFPEIIASLRRLSLFWDDETNAPHADAENMIQEFGS